MQQTTKNLQNKQRKFNLLLLEDKEEFICELLVNKLKMVNPIYFKGDHPSNSEITEKLDPYSYFNIASIKSSM